MLPLCITASLLIRVLILGLVLAAPKLAPCWEVVR